jgi:hypothetical protein
MSYSSLSPRSASPTRGRLPMERPPVRPLQACAVIYTTTQKAPRVLPFVRRLKGATNARHGPRLEGSKPDRSGLPGLTAVNPGDAAGQASTSPHVRRLARLAVAAAVELEDRRLNWAPVRAAICQRDCGGRATSCMAGRGPLRRRDLIATVSKFYSGVPERSHNLLQ